MIHALPLSAFECNRNRVLPVSKVALGIQHSEAQLAEILVVEVADSVHFLQEENAGVARLDLLDDSRGAEGEIEDLPWAAEPLRLGQIRSKQVIAHHVNDLLA